jgi:hypothetical protein
MPGHWRFVTDGSVGCLAAVPVSRLDYGRQGGPEQRGKALALLTGEAAVWHGDGVMARVVRIIQVCVRDLPILRP